MLGSIYDTHISLATAIHWHKEVGLPSIHAPVSANMPRKRRSEYYFSDNAADGILDMQM
jgi:hypothetical protein